MTQKITQALMGCLDIPLFLKTGIGRFENSWGAAKLSFAVPVVLLPLVATVAPFNPQYQGQTYLMVLLQFVLLYLLTTALYLPLMYIITKSLGKLEAFPRFVGMQNWVGISGFVIILPILLGMSTGRWEWEEAYPLFVTMTLYSYAYVAFAITYTFSINWMLATSLSILGMACDDIARMVIDAVFQS